MLVLLRTPLSAQEVVGVVSDSATQLALSGGVVVVLDPRGATLLRGLTSDRGRYRVALPPHSSHLEFRHIGYRPRLVALAALQEGQIVLDVTMSRLPTMLEPVRVLDGTDCPRRADRAAALGLWEQARTGLLAAVVARKVAVAQMVLLKFERSIDHDRVVGQRVEVDSKALTSEPFIAARTSAQFVSGGFATVDAEGSSFFAPDADVLLDPALMGGYCFHLAPRDSSRPTAVGLALAPVRRRVGHVDIEGTVWVDTAARALRELVFRYVAADRAIETPPRTGRVAFRTLANGVVIVDQWSLRLAEAHSDTSSDAGRSTVVHRRYSTREVGGEVARAVWSSGYSWHGSLGTLHLHAVTRDGKAISGAELRLRDTDYRAVTDSSGNVEIGDVLPGLYVVEVGDSALTPLGLRVSTDVVVRAVRDSVARVTVTVPSLSEHAEKICHARPLRSSAGSEQAWLLGRAVHADGSPVEGAKWVIAEPTQRNFRPLAGGRTGADGTFSWCDGLEVGATIEVRAWQRNDRPSTVPVVLTFKVTTVRVELPFD